MMFELFSTSDKYIYYPSTTTSGQSQIYQTTGKMGQGSYSDDGPEDQSLPKENSISKQAPREVCFFFIIIF